MNVKPKDMGIEMIKLKQLFTAYLLAFALFPTVALATDSSVTHSLPGVQGYDVVAYFTADEPQKGNGNYTVIYHGVTYLFANKANRAKFKKNPQRYLPAYGGFCAFAVMVGKKVVGDPLAWKIVDNKLYLNLNKKVQHRWEQDIPGNISKADTKWPEIKDVPVEQL
jgi:YHS domain-containing protein